MFQLALFGRRVLQQEDDDGRGNEAHERDAGGEYAAQEFLTANLRFGCRILEHASRTMIVGEHAQRERGIDGSEEALLVGVCTVENRHGNRLFPLRVGLPFPCDEPPSARYLEGAHVFVQRGRQRVERPDAGPIRRRKIRICRGRKTPNVAFGSQEYTNEAASGVLRLANFVLKPEGR